MQRIALVTYEGKPDLSVSDAGIVPLLRQQGIEVSVVPWTSAIDWHEFSLVLIRSAWDYHTRYQEFLRWIQVLESQNVSVWNTPSTLRWNTDKTYLDRIVTDDIRIVPTIVVPDKQALPDNLPWDEVIIKPSIGASSYGVRRMNTSSPHAWRMEAERQLREGAVLLQEYQPQIKNGEHSFVFFDKKFSHAVLKTPRPDEFRVQSEFGGRVTPVIADEHTVHKLERLLTALPDPLLYARIDGLLDAETFTLMEIELCEPELFLNTDAMASNRFAEAILRRIGR